MDVTKPYKFTGFGAMDVTKPYKFKGSSAGRQPPNPLSSLGGAPASQTPVEGGCRPQDSPETDLDDPYKKLIIFIGRQSAATLSVCYEGFNPVPSCPPRYGGFNPVPSCLPRYDLGIPGGLGPVVGIVV